MMLRRSVLAALIGLGLLAPAGCGPTPGSSRADRGIGGTGGPQQADRGIGGTGGPSLADRGIGGTGGTAIVGAITGFGSVFVNGFEIRSDRIAVIDVDGAPEPFASLRVGQVARVIAQPDAGGLRAEAVTVEHEVIGPIERLGGEQSSGDDSLVVAGQRVRLLAGVSGGTPAVGDWVAVSGFRTSSGEILASRVERHAAGDVLVTGQLVQAGKAWRVGGLVIEARSLSRFTGQRVRVRGRLLGRVLAAGSVARAPLLPLRPGLDHAVLQTVAMTGPGRLRLGEGLDAQKGPAIGSLPANLPVIIALVAASDGSLTATAVLDFGGGSSGTQGALPSAQPGGVPSTASHSSTGSSGSGRGGGSNSDSSESSGHGSGGGGASNGGGSSGGGSSGGGGGGSGGGGGGGGSGGGGGGGSGSGGGGGGSGGGGGGSQR